MNTTLSGSINMTFDVKTFMTSLAPYVDGMGMLAQGAPWRDGGDSCHRTNVVVTALVAVGERAAATQYYYDNIKAFKASETEYRRHPDQSKWYSRPENFSRDQTSMLLVAAAMVGDTDTVKNIALQLLKRKGFHQNTHPNYVVPGDEGYKAKTPDFIAPSEIAAIIRGTNAVILYPLLWVLDAFFFVDILLASMDDSTSKRSEKKSRTDQYVMLVSHLFLSKQKMDTPIAALARKLLKKFDYAGSFRFLFEDPRWSDPPLHNILIPATEAVL